MRTDSSVLPPNHLWNIRRYDEHNSAVDHVVEIMSAGQHPQPRQQRADGAQPEDGTREIAVPAAATPRIERTACAHPCECSREYESRMHERESECARGDDEQCRKNPPDQPARELCSPISGAADVGPTVLHLSPNHGLNPSSALLPRSTCLRSAPEGTVPSRTSKTRSSHPPSASRRRRSSDTRNSKCTHPWASLPCDEPRNADT